MKLAAVECLLPSKEVDNDAIVDLVKFYSKPIFEGDLEQTLRKVRKYLTSVGSKTRYWHEKHERPLDMIVQSADNAFKYANMSKKDIDLLIYVGIDRGFLEPANASFIAQSIGVPYARTFDIVDACMGWCTACHIAQAMMETGEICNASIISSEFVMVEGGTVIPESFRLKNENELKWKLPSFTLGEAVSATILSKSENSHWRFVFKSDSNLADLCTLPLEKCDRYSEYSEKIGPSGSMNFSAFGDDLAKKCYRDVIGILLKLLRKSKEPKFIFPHSISKKGHDKVSKLLGIKSKMYSTFEDFGNLATSSIPSEIALAIKKNELKKGDFSIGWMASAGVKYSAFEIYY